MNQLLYLQKKSPRKNNKKRDPCGLRIIAICIRLLLIDYAKFANNILVKLNLIEFL
jgi:hypothetical protein